MNILIILFSFLAVLGISATAFWNTTSAIHLQTKSFCGYLTAERNAVNSLQRKIFKKLPTASDAPNSPSSSGSSKTSNLYRNPRLQPRPHQYARLQLSGLWDSIPHPYVENAFRRLLDELYDHLSWYVKDREKGTIDTLVDNIVRFGKKTKGEFEFSDLFSALSDAEAKVFYKMIMGTTTYTLENRTGSPPLLDFISFSPINMKHTCCFSFASLPLLRALFDKDTVSEILDLEKKKWEKDQRLHTCTKKELLALLQYRPKSPTQPAMIETYFFFGRKSGSRDRIFGEDKVSGIHVKAPVKNSVSNVTPTSKK